MRPREEDLALPSDFASEIAMLLRIADDFKVTGALKTFF